MESKKICQHKCCVCGYRRTLSANFSLHSIPVKTDELADAWHRATGINKNLFIHGAKVCSRHFIEADFSPTAITIRRLNSNAIPSNHLEYLHEMTGELMQEENFQIVTIQENYVENVLSNLSTNSDTEMLINNSVYEDTKSEKKKQFNDYFLDFLQSNSIQYSTIDEKVVTETSCTQTINTTQDESSRIDFHNQPSTSKQLFNYSNIQPTIPTKSDYEIHYYDIDYLSYDNQQPPN